MQVNRHQQNPDEKVHAHRSQSKAAELSPVNKKIEDAHESAERADEKALTNNEVDAFGEILHAGWLEKRQLVSNISNDRIDYWYERARAAGAIGGKLLGAGGGGFILLYAPPRSHEAICKALPELRPVPFKFCPQGSKIIYVEENGYMP